MEFCKSPKREVDHLNSFKIESFDTTVGCQGKPFFDISELNFMKCDFFKKYYFHPSDNFDIQVFLNIALMFHRVESADYNVFYNSR